ncbi:MAG: hypothetical protein QXV17_07620 [Candidatus Micrarchaeaceae archaeon]
MKEITNFVPFWNFQDGDFIGYFDSMETINGQTVGRFSTGSGDEYLIGSAQIAKMVENGKFEKGQKYLIKFVGQTTIASGKFKGRKANTFKVFAYDDNEAES